MSYQDFLMRKVAQAERTGFEIDPDEIHPSLFPHQRDAALWALRGGRRAQFMSFGLGKTRVQLEMMRQTYIKRGGRGLIVCPLQLDIVERVIERYTNQGEMVLDPFAGIFTVPYMAIKMGRKGIGVELNPDYFKMGVGYCRSAEAERDVPTLFDALEVA